MVEGQSVSEILESASPGDGETATKLFPIVYAELRALASSYLERKPGHTLQPTALVHEAYLKLVGADRAWSGRDHFAATAAKAMRQVLVDHARRKGAMKRGGGIGRAHLEIEAEIEATDQRGMRVLELDVLLTELAQADARAAQVAEMRLFGGMNQDQIALVLGVSRKTITLDWRFARAWLAGKAQLQEERSDGSEP